MKFEEEALEDLLFELREVEKVNHISDENGPYSITVDYGALLTLLCCQ